MTNVPPVSPMPQIAVISNAAISRLLSGQATSAEAWGKQPAARPLSPWRTAVDAQREAPTGGLPTIAGREELFERVERAKREWESTVDSLPDLVCLIDQAGKVIRANRIVEEWGLGRVETVRGQNWHELLHPACQQPACYLAELAQKVMPQVIQGETLDQTEHDPVLDRYLQFHAHPVLDRDQASTYTAVVVVHDVTEQRAAEQERERLIADLDAYAHTVAHDLKNPVGLVIGYAEFLAKEWRTLPADEVLGCLLTIERVGHKLNDIIDELLLFADVQDAPVEVRPLNMGGVVAEALERVRNLITKYQAEVITPPSWPTAIGYRQWIEEVWVNYLSNALKYGGRPPRVELGGEVRLDGTVKCWVRDNGVGIAPDDQARLFQRFSGRRQGRIHGHGLGLSIVQRIVERLGGQVGVESGSRSGEGSTFYFILPAAE